MLRIDDDDDEDPRVMIEGKNTSDQTVLNRAMGNKPNDNKSNGYGSSVSHKETVKSPTVSKSDDKRLVLLGIR